MTPAGRRRAGAEDLAWLGIIPAVAILAVALLWLAPPLSDHLYPHPDYGFFPEWDWIVRPEPAEQTRFVIAIAIPLLGAGLVAWRGSSRPADARFDPAIIATQAGLLAFVVWAVARQEGEANAPPSRSDYFDPLLLSVPILVAGVVFGAGLTALLLRGAGLPPRISRLFERLRGRSQLAIGAAALATAGWLLPAVVTDGTLAEAGSIPTSHIPFQFQDALAPLNGRTPLVDFIPRYSTLMYLPVAPILRTFDLSLTSYSITQCVLSAVGLICIYAALAQITKSRWAALGLYVPFLAVSLFPWSDSGVVREFNGNYYALFPARYLGPFIVAWLGARYLRRGSPPLAVVFFATGLAVVNNVEFGLPCLIALIAAIWLGGASGAPDWGRLRVQAAHAAGGLLAALVLVSAIILIRSGELPDFGLLGYAARIFGAEAYSLLPMPTWGIHWALYLTYVGALLVAAVRFVNGSSDRALTGMLGFAGVFGLLTGGYFAGRSDPFGVMALFPVWGLAIALLVWATVPLLREARLDRRRLRRVLIPGFGVLVGFGVAVAAIARFPAPWDQIERLSDTEASVLEYPAQQRFIDDRTAAGETILLLGTRVDHRIAERAGVANVSPVGAADYLFSRREFDRALDQLQEEGGRKVFESFDNLGFFQAPLRSPISILRDRGFRVVASDSATGLREWNR